MPRPIQQHDERTTDLSPAALFTVLQDFRAYEAWWPAQFRVRLERGAESSGARGARHVGSRVSITPLPFITTGWELTHLVPDKELGVRYYRGPHDGTGLWRMAREGRLTRYSYSIDLMPKSFVVSAAYAVGNVRKMHSGHIASLFDALETRARTVCSA